MFLGVHVERTTELHTYTCSNPCSLVFTHPRSQAGTGKCNHCLALPSSDSHRLQTSNTAPPHQGKDLPLLPSSGWCSEQPPSCCLGGAEAAQPLQPKPPETQPWTCSAWAATEDQQHKHLQDQKEFTATAEIFYIF